MALLGFFGHWSFIKAVYSSVNQQRFYVLMFSLEFMLGTEPLPRKDLTFGYPTPEHPQALNPKPNGAFPGYQWRASRLSGILAFSVGSWDWVFWGVVGFRIERFWASGAFRC